MKYELNTTIYYLLSGNLHSAPITARMVVENLHEDWVATSAQVNLFTPFGRAGVYYSTCHGIIEEAACFLSKKHLYEHLILG